MNIMNKGYGYLFVMPMIYKNGVPRVHMGPLARSVMRFTRVKNVSVAYSS